MAAINMESDPASDYGEYEYQQAQFAVGVQEDDDTTDPKSVSTAAIIETEPLAGQGGLDNNEVAELVYLETNAHLEFEDETDDQTDASEAHLRGVIGANLPDSTSGFVERAGLALDGERFDLTDPDDTGQATGATKSDDRIFQMFSAHGGIPFDNTASGPGGAASHEAFYAEKKWRELTGRGPVLDSTDSISALLDINAGDSNLIITGNVRCHMVWDVAETSDAGRAFSVPR